MSTTLVLASTDLPTAAPPAEDPLLVAADEAGVDEPAGEASGPWVFPQVSAPVDDGLARADRGACPSGVVVLTFDDGPDAELTRRLLRTLDDLNVPAVFFMVGRRVAQTPGTARAAHRAGHRIANHSYAHDQMTKQTNAAIRSTLRRTDTELRAAGVRPTPLMRPPYGDMDARVERVIRGAGLVPVMWDVDPRDWERWTTQQIADRVLARLQPGGRNIVLQHDGIRNSPASIAAVPRIVRQARNRGYCFGTLDDAGRPVLPTPRVTASIAPRTEGEDLVVRLRLNAATIEPTSVRVRTRDGSAVAGVHYQPVSTRVRFRPGRTTATVRIPTTADDVYRADTRLTVELSAARGLVIGTAQVPGRIVESMRPPRVRLIGGITRASEPSRDRTGEVTVRLGRVSGRRAVVVLQPARRSGLTWTQRVVIPAGSREVTVPVEMPRVRRSETARLRVWVVRTSHARATDEWTKVAVRPAQ